MEIRPPLRGLAEITPKGVQPELTTRSTLNTRPFCGVDQRIQLSKRPGLTKFVTDAIGTSRVQRVFTSVYDSRLTSYAAQSPATEWGKTFRDRKPVFEIAKDKQENLYVIQGLATLLKVNSAGETVGTFKLPVEDENQSVRALAVDESGNIFAAVSEGGEQDKSRLWRFKQKTVEDEWKPELVWTVELEFFIEHMRVQGGQLVCGANWTDRGLSEVVVYSTLLDSAPTEIRRTRVSEPINAVDIGDEGNIFWCSEPKDDRNIDPRFPAFSPRTSDRRIEDLEEFEKRVWAWYKASDLSSDHEENDSVPLWEDRSGNKRHLFQSLVTGDGSPIFNPEGIGGRPSVRFRGRRHGDFRDALQTNYNASSAPGNADQQSTSIPGYRGAKWAMFMVIRPNYDLPGTDPADPRSCVWSCQMGEDTHTPEDGEISFFTNRIPFTTASEWTGQAADGYVSFYGFARPAFPGASGASHNQPIPGWFGNAVNGYHTANDTGALIVTLLYDGGDATADGASVTKCTLRVNGRPLDRWEGQAMVLSEPFYLGRLYDGIGGGGSPDGYFYEGEIAELLVLRDTELAGKMGLIEHPRYPRVIGTGATVPVAWNSASDTELEKIEGILMHEYGISHLAPTGSAVSASGIVADPSYDPGIYPHPYYFTSGPPLHDDEDTRSEPFRIHAPKGIVGKLDGSTGKILWIATSSDSVGIGGIGYGLRVFEDRVYCAGPKIDDAPGTAPWTYLDDPIDARSIVDTGETGAAGYSIDPGDEAWKITFSATATDMLTYKHPRLDVDEHGNVYIPTEFIETPDVDNSFSVKVLSKGLSAGVATTPHELASIECLDGKQPGYAVAVPKSPVYRLGTDTFEENPTTAAEVPRAESVYIGTDVNAASSDSLSRVELVSTTGSSGSPRTMYALGVSAGVLKVFTSSTVASPAGGDTIAQPEFRTDAQYIAACQGFGKVFFTDGRSYVYYDPKTDEAKKWTATDGGKIPPRYKLLVNWRGRAVFARGVDDPHGWYMSEQGDFFHWNTSPDVRTPKQAVAGVNARAGLCPDLINAMIPYSDDLLIFGCDSSIWALRGDPASAIFGGGAQFDLVSDITGMSFGSPWCKDPLGVLYFFGSRGGVYRMAPGVAPQSLSDQRLPQRLRDIDLGTHHIEMCWDDDFGGVVVAVIPFGTVTAPTECYYWHQGTESWWADKWGTTADFDTQPTCVLTFDGDDPDDRVVMFGCNDGHVRFIDADAETDDGTVIDSYCLIGPLLPDGVRQRARVMHPQIVTRADLQEMGWRLRVSEDPSTTGDVAMEGTAKPGRNERRLGGGRGSYIWFEVFGYKRWSIEAIDVSVESAGAARV